ncbi:HSP20 family small heat-shock protein [Streptomyces sp. NBC_01728]|uniref:Hsp20/alpha crystallin family protein n=1 Tax=unclassified Streptomyces TaxID=2593676 RepID=UPI00224F4146|nr:MULTISPECIES: Hsp20 family protein [unclassified Streptomyces]MCX4458918.1 HSP20 family small heat-shock protein [Streptomyces sp. NBC_01719]MCX4498275.1 HSP20 family small heat-shock protein [Streptomyces sp. NBC_01728]
MCPVRSGRFAGAFGSSRRRRRGQVGLCGRVARPAGPVSYGQGRRVVEAELPRRQARRHRHRDRGHFEYNSLLPTDVKADVNATLSDGVLTVTVPKAQAAKPRHIEIAEP